jgi:hypothetical protein
VNGGYSYSSPYGPTSRTSLRFAYTSSTGGSAGTPAPLGAAKLDMACRAAVRHGVMARVVEMRPLPELVAMERVQQPNSGGGGGVQPMAAMAPLAIPAMPLLGSLVSNRDQISFYSRRPCALSLRLLSRSDEWNLF